MQPKQLQAYWAKKKKHDSAMAHAKGIQKNLAKTSGKMGMKKCHCAGKDKNCKKCKGKGFY